MGKRIALLFIVVCFLLVTAATYAASPSSTNFQLRDYSFGSGGTEQSDSTNFSLFGILGEVSQGDPSSTNFQVLPGLPNTIMPALPPAPTFNNPGSLYDRLRMIISTAGNPSDTTYAVAITEASDTSWTYIRYIQSDGSIGTTLGLEDFLTYTAWGGASGTYITNLQPNTTYKIKVKARQGEFTETGWGPEAVATTSIASLSFGVDSDAIIFDDLNSLNSFTDDTKSTVMTTTTNAYNGYIVYGFATQPLTANSQTIPHYGSPNSSPTVWSGYGFGYSSGDTSLTGGTADRFTNGGPKYAGFTGTPPGDPIVDTPGPIITPIIAQQFEVDYRVSANPTTPAGVYQSIIVYIIVPTY
ncbi:hypothetical protein IPM65_03640 [Candidatus Roizmanbacteria bacterium]|nr:MAG: hypothetical protein IPM65_03640 [Candidatus Roizmanbacteria bacterium]